MATLGCLDGVAQSDPDTVTITTLNTAPVANAGDNTNARVQETVLLDGTGSVDVDGDCSSFSWSLTTVPQGSAAALDHPDVPRPRFLLDWPGTYVAQLIVHDGTVASEADTITVTTSNTAPLANAGKTRPSSSLPRWWWTAVRRSMRTSIRCSIRGRSRAGRQSARQYDGGGCASPELRRGCPGTYVLQLIVSDNTVESTPDTVVVTTMNSVPSRTPARIRPLRQVPRCS